MFAVRSDSRQGRQSGLTKAQLAAKLHVSTRAVEKWVARGCPRRLDGRFDLAAVRLWYQEHVRQRSDSRACTPGLAYWRTQLEKQRALIEEHKRRELAASLIPVDTVRRRRQRQFALATKVLGKLPGQFASLLPKSTKVRERRQFEQEVSRLVADVLIALDDGNAEGSPAEVSQDA